ncbi:MAG: tRNA pseudouridine(38-40) synthase TruA [Myxococcota bacterium]
MLASPRKRNIKLIIEYDGTAYAGWQYQDHQPTVQGTLQHAIQRMLGHAVTLWVAGRTDAGVHAIAQVANFYTDSCIPTHKFPPGFNSYLPADISVHCAEEVDEAFNAKRDSHSKRYRYRIYQGPQGAALEHRAWHLRSPLDVAAMHQASRCLVGELDFNAFRSVHCDAPHAIRHMFDIAFNETERPPVGRHIDITFHANAYCRHMCRILAGTLAEVGQGRRSIASVAAILRSADRRQAGVTAPPKGLTLLSVGYADPTVS